MVFTRYFNTHVKLTTQLVNNIRNIVETSPVALAGADGTGQPEITTTRICFNGEGVNAGQAFILTHGNNANFCATEEKPYDAVVLQILNLLRTLDKDFYTDTDGYDDADETEAEFTKIFN